METNQQLKNKNLEKKDQITFFEKMTYPAKYLELRYGVSQFFIYLVFIFIVIGIFLFLGMQNRY